MTRPRNFLFLAIISALGLAGATPALVFGETTGEIVDRMIDAHGGMERWAGAPSVSFAEVWSSPGMGAAPAHEAIVEQGRRRARLEVPSSGGVAVWDGEKAWSVNWSGGPPRFLVALNYYFLNLPWLVKDPGVILGEPGQGESVDGESYITIRMTYEPGVGDTPDDYYVLYIDPETYRLHGCDYVVTYRPLVPEGMDSTPEHHLVFESHANVDGLLVPTAFTIYEGKDVYASCAISDWSFTKPFDPALVEMPEGAVIDRSLDDTGE